MSPLPIKVELRETGTEVDGSLFDEMEPADMALVENEWSAERSLIHQELLAKKVDRGNWPQSLHWNWGRKAPLLQSLESRGFGIVCENRWQGVMLTKTATAVCQLPADRGRPLVYIDFLETAPWNWQLPAVGRSGRFRAIGSRLFLRAVQQSHEEGFHGRVGLHTLPQSQQFYLRCGMTPLGRDAAKQSLLYLELSRESAQSYLSSGYDA